MKPKNQPTLFPDTDAENNGINFSAFDAEQTNRHISSTENQAQVETPITDLTTTEFEQEHEEQQTIVENTKEQLPTTLVLHTQPDPNSVVDNEYEYHYQHSFLVQGAPNTISTPVVTPLPTTATSTLNAYLLQTTPLIAKATAILAIATDDENTLARTLAKQMAELKTKINKQRIALNKPDEERIEARNLEGKKIIDPLDAQITRFKNIITQYETNKETKRLAAIKKLADDKAKADADKAAEVTRVKKIRDEIQRLRQASQKSINATTTVEALNKIQLGLNGFKPKKEFFAEFYAEVNTTLRAELQTLIDGRLPIVTELEALNEQNAELAQQTIENEKIQNEQAEALKKVEDDNAELQARQELMVLISSLDIKDFEQYINNLLTQYGTCIEASKNRDAIIQQYTATQAEQQQIENLEAAKIKNQRVDYIFTITNPSKVPLEYLCVDEAKIKKAIQDNRKLLLKDINAFSIDGITITAKTNTVLK